MHVSSPAHQTKTIQHSHSSAVTTAMTFMLLGGKCVLALNKSAANAPNAYVVEADIDGAPKADSQAWTINAPLYWDDTNKVFTTSSGSGANTLAGYARAAYANTAGIVTGNITLISRNP